jgi:signal transduction histidine kinase
MSVSPNPRLTAGRRPAMRAASPSASWPRALGLRLAPLVQATRLDELLPLVARLAEEAVDGRDAFVILVDGPSEPDEASARNAAGRPVPPTAYRQLFRGQGVPTHLARGLHVQQIDADGAVRLLVPLVHDSSLRAALGVTIPVTTRPLGRIVDALRDVGQQAAPLVARLREIEDLRRLVGGLTVLVQEGAHCQTRMREKEEELRTVRLQAAMKSQLTANVNHALRTPLVAIRGYTRLLLDEPGTMDETQRQYLDVVSRNAERLVDVAQNLMAPSTVRLKLERVDVGRCWGQGLAAARESAAARGIRVVESVPGATVPLTADESRIRQMIAELAVGALEAAREGDELRAELLDETQRVVLTMTVRPAAPASVQEAGEEPATGLSLRLDTVREIANLHGGRVAVARDAVRGRAVSVVLPRVSLEE